MEETPSTHPARLVPFKVVVRLVQNFINGTFKSKEGAVQKVSSQNDAYAVYYSKEDLDKLFASHGYKDGDSGFGLRIYLGLHGTSDEERQAMPDRPEHYIGQHTVALVCTKEGQDLLDDEAALALEEGQLCPPPSPCGSIGSELTD
jgi:hypothetical protein